MIIIYGPTGVGKTDFSTLIANSLPIEIINMDMGSFYTPLTIGTAKPAWRHSSIPHHLFDIINSPMHYTVMQYRMAVSDLINDIKKRGNVPVLVGGSGFYLKSLFFPPVLGLSKGSNAINKNDISSAELWQKLYTIDAARAEKIHPNDRYRIERALTIFEQTGRKASEQIPYYQPIGNAHIILMTREREQLYERINERVDTMIENGWLEEVNQLRGSEWEQFLYEKKIIGYNDLLYCSSGVADWESTIATIKTKSRNYAKRQLTFWRMFKAQLDNAHSQPNQKKMVTSHAINLTFINLELYLKQLVYEFEKQTAK